MKYTHSFDDDDTGRFMDLFDTLDINEGEIIIDKAPPWQRMTSYKSCPVLNPFNGRLEDFRSGYVDNPDFDPGLESRIEKAKGKIIAKARRDVFRSGVFKAGSHIPSDVSVEILLPRVDGTWRRSSLSVENPEVEAMRNWVYYRGEENRNLMESIKDEIPLSEVSREVELVEPTYWGYSLLQKRMVTSNKLSRLVTNVKNQLGKSIVKRREVARKANKPIFEFPDVKVSSSSPITYYRPKFMRLINTFSKGDYYPSFITEDYTLDTKGRWPKRDGHKVIILSKPRWHPKWGNTIVVEDLDKGDRLRVNIKYLRPPEDKILKWE